jgi:uncharacterized C2H2 Zn-finger protein
MKITVSGHTRRSPAPIKLKCPCCGRWYQGGKKLAQHAVRTHSIGAAQIGKTNAGH